MVCGPMCSQEVRHCLPHTGPEGACSDACSASFTLAVPHIRGAVLALAGTDTGLLHRQGFQIACEATDPASHWNFRIDGASWQRAHRLMSVAAAGSLLDRCTPVLPCVAWLCLCHRLSARLFAPAVQADCSGCCQQGRPAGGCGSGSGPVPTGGWAQGWARRFTAWTQPHYDDSGWRAKVVPAGSTDAAGGLGNGPPGLWVDHAGKCCAPAHTYWRIGPFDRGGRAPGGAGDALAALTVQPTGVVAAAAVEAGLLA
jgi:hypothetical protein